MEAISTTWINFVGNGGGSPEFVNSQTGDTVSIIAFVIAVLCAFCAFVFARYAVPANHAKSSLPSVFSNAKLNKILAIVLGAAAAVSLVAGIAINSTKALAESNGNAEVSDSINAVVDEATGAVTIDAGWIKSGTGTLNYCEDVALNYESGIEGLENCTWTVQIGQKIVAENVTAPTSDEPHKFNHEEPCVAVEPATLLVTVNGLDAATAKSLIGKKVLQIDFRVYTPEQNSSSQTIDNGWNEILEVLDNETEFPDNVLYPEFKAGYRNDINEAKKVADEEMKEDPTKHEIIKNTFIIKRDELVSTIEDKRDEIIADKTNKKNELTTAGSDLSQTIENEGWFTQEEKDEYQGRLSLFTDRINLIDGTKSQAATDNLNTELSSGIAALGDEVDEAAATAEAEKKDDALAYADAQKTEFEAFLSQSISDGLWEEDAETYKGDLGEAVTTYKTSIQNASSLNELATAKATFDSSITALRETTIAATKADKKDKENKIALQKQSLDGFKAQFESAKSGLYQDTIGDIESTISDISDDIDNLEQVTSQTVFNAALEALRAELAQASMKLTQAIWEESSHKSAQLAALEGERATDKGEIDTTPRLSDGKKDEFKASIDEVIDAAIDYVSNDAASTTDAEIKVAEAKAACDGDTGILKDARELVEPWNVEWPSYDVVGSQHWIWLESGTVLKVFDDAPHAVDSRGGEDFFVNRSDPTIEGESATSFDVYISTKASDENLAVRNLDASENAYNVTIKVSFESVDSEGNPLTQDSPAPVTEEYDFTIHVNKVFLANRNDGTGNRSIIAAYYQATSVEFSLTAPTSSIDSMDVDYGKNGAIKAYKVDDGSGGFKVIIASVDESPMASNEESLASLFTAFSNVTTVKSEDFAAIDTSHATKLNGMFSSLSKVTSISLTFNTRNVLEFWAMFEKCPLLKTITLTGAFYESSSPNARLTNMFEGCSALEHIYVPSGTDLRDGTPDSSDMFAGCVMLPNYVAGSIQDRRHAYVGNPGEDGYLEAAS